MSTPCRELTIAKAYSTTGNFVNATTNPNDQVTPIKRKSFMYTLKSWLCLFVTASDCLNET